MPPAIVPSTPLQHVLVEFGKTFEHAVEQLDERGYSVFVDIATIRIAREHARRLERERRRAA